MRKKEIHTTILVIFLGLISIYLFTILDMQLKESAQRVDVVKYNIYRILEILVLIFLGFLIEYKRVIFAFKNRISINKYYLITGSGLIILLVLPLGFVSQLGIGLPFSFRKIILVLISTNTRSILSILAGIFLARSLSDSETNEQIS